MEFPIGKPGPAATAGRAMRRGMARASGKVLLALIPLWAAHVCLGQESPKPAGKAEPVQVLPDKAAPLPARGATADAKGPPPRARLKAPEPAETAKEGEGSPRRKRGITAPPAGPGAPIQATPVEGQADLIDVIRPKAMKSDPSSARPPN